jgi:hypothetical protein
MTGTLAVRYVLCCSASCKCQLIIVEQLLTGENKLLLAEFKYGLEPKESFKGFFDQGKPQRAFYPLKTVSRHPRLERY